MLSFTGRAHALAGCDTGPRELAEVQLEGLSATRAETLLELLPRRPPARYTLPELDEFERRLNNLGIFDAVSVACAGAALQIGVREKWTLVPEIDFATGKTFADTYALLGATEYNFLGTANQLGVSVVREQRGFGVSVGWNEHDYQRHRWSKSAAVSLATAAWRFDAESGWRTTSATLELSARSPPWLHQYFNYIAGLYASSESVYDAKGAAPPPSTQVLQSFMGFSWDAYEWHDLVPSGVQASAWFSIGGLFGVEPAQPRHTAEFLFRGALPLAASTLVIGRAEAAFGTRGNANYAFVLGSVGGVRGLRDATYYNWAQLLANLELRQSFELWARWAAQAVAFVDTAAFEQLTIDGARGERERALSLGLGARVVPTWIASIALRLDVARLLVPETAWFTQLGLNQYF